MLALDSGSGLISLILHLQHKMLIMHCVCGAWHAVVLGMPCDVLMVAMTGMPLYGLMASCMHQSIIKTHGLHCTAAVHHDDEMALQG